MARFSVQQLHGSLPRCRTKMNQAHYESNSYLNEISSPVSTVSSGYSKHLLFHADLDQARMLNLWRIINKLC